MRQSGLTWYRLPEGKGLATAPPDDMRCGTTWTGWLSGWPVEATEDSSYAVRQPGTDGPDDPGQPGRDYATPPAAGFVCFDVGQDCIYSNLISVVSCGAFALWELPPTRDSNCLGYCLSSGAGTGRRLLALNNEPESSVPTKAMTPQDTMQGFQTEKCRDRRLHGPVATGEGVKEFIGTVVTELHAVR